MRIVCFSVWFYDYVIQMANALSKYADVLLILPDTLSKDEIEEINENVKFLSFNFSKRILHPTNILSWLRIKKEIEDFSPDIVHVQVQGLFLCPLLILLKKYHIIATFHDIAPHEGEENIFYRLILIISRLFSDKIIVHGQNLKKSIIEDFHVNSEKVFSIPIGEHEVAPFHKRLNATIREEKNTILFFGRIWKYKGLEYLIKAEPLITKKIPDAKIIIAGTGEDFTKYQEIMVNKNRFTVYNYRIPYEEGAILFQRCSVVVLPYIEGSQSGVIPTAYSFKKPVICTDVGSLAEIVENGKTGLVIPPKDEISLANSIIYLLENDEKRKIMGDEGYKKLKSDLSWENISKDLICIYNGINNHLQSN
ncbi:glycosyltransferase family 4 protein [Methanocalculus sp.]|uniref:glycosyltransferase family 4 protein n=1 Tax=Methanocalculus sp. TaxID=2004547 RepID=UPI002628B431|nr:glycosyltransferase family 4 protein [Methanocalculus sp.]MDG6249249.1 glycosyltransferase family 4 protein [Methanocalculus sp.]